jgi:hypothetical protein
MNPPSEPCSLGYAVQLMPWLATRSPEAGDRESYPARLPSYMFEYPDRVETPADRPGIPEPVSVLPQRSIERGADS